MNATEILRRYTSGEFTAEQVNAELANIGVDQYHLDTEKNKITTEEQAETSLGLFPPATVNGFGLLDTGTGTLDKVEVRAGQLANMDCGEMYALLYIGGEMFKIEGKKLVTP